MQKYNPAKIEKKWQAYWEEHGTFKTSEKPTKKQYILDMFPYPSGAGLHVGHPEGYTATDILTRFLRMNGYSVLHPMGWDAFGLPAENYAIKMGVPPDETTAKNITRFREQIKAIGLSYDWSREVNTSDPNYYKWTHWLFLLMYKNGLAYKKEAKVNWCPKDNTVLANEQVVNGHCERCGTQVEQKLLSQWFLKITDYTERLLNDLDALDWPNPIKAMQRNWIGRKEGVIIEHRVKDLGLKLETFSAFPAWLFADTFIVIAPEHPLVTQLVEGTGNEPAVQAFIEETKLITADERNQDKFEKKGVFTGRYAIDPFSGLEMPIWVANFALMDFGTGIIRCSAHDPRDFEFAQKYGIELHEVVDRTNESEPVNAHDNSGVLKDSGSFTGRNIDKALIEEMLDWMEQEGFAKRHVTYKLRDWLISRQRYWGAPIPIIYCDACGMQPVAEPDLPVNLPTDVDFVPTGESPLTRSKTFHEVNCPKCAGPARRDSDTMDTFVDSSWYYFRYTDSNNDKEFAGKDKINTWLPVDTYVGGAEHAVLHLLYSRFFTKVLFDLKLIDFEEPFVKLRNQGLILGPDGEKMSKSRGNVINPDDIIKEFGADSLRMYEMFMGPLEDSKPWNTNGLIGLKRFLERVWVWVNDNKQSTAVDSELVSRELHKLTKKITNDIQSFNFNTAISAFMKFYNNVKGESVSKQTLQTFIILLYPFAPHITEELNEILGGVQSVQHSDWPQYNAELASESQADIVVQINGKTKDKLQAPLDATEDDIKTIALSLDKVQAALQGVEPKRVIVVPGRLVNIVI